MAIKRPKNKQKLKVMRHRLGENDRTPKLDSHSEQRQENPAKKGRKRPPARKH